MLTLHQSNEYNRHKTLSDFFAVPANTTILNTYLPFKNQVLDYNANISAFEALVPNKEVITKGITKGKETIKHKIADTMALYCCKTRAFALLNNHPDLAGAMNTKSSAILHLKDADVLPFVQHACGLITPYLTDAAFTPYGITAANLTALTNEATTFKNSIGIADTTASVSNIANKDINQILKKLSDNMEQFDLLINHFAASNADFVKGYLVNSTLASIGIHHTGIEGIITDVTGNPVSGVSVKITGTKKITQTDLLGQFTIISIKPGDYQIEVSQTGYKKINEVHYFTRGQIDTLNMKMEKM